MGYNFVTCLTELKYNKRCYISDREFTEKDCECRNVVELDCKHAFHYPIFMKSYFELNTNIHTYLKCPYCMADISPVPFKIRIKNR